MILTNMVITPFDNKISLQILHEMDLIYIMVTLR